MHASTIAAFLAALGMAVSANGQRPMMADVCGDCPAERLRGVNDLAFGNDGYPYITEASAGAVWRVPVATSGQALFHQLR